MRQVLTASGGPGRCLVFCAVAYRRTGSAVSKTIDITELCLRDAHQSLLATRMAMEDMVPACADIDQAGYWSVE